MQLRWCQRYVPVALFIVGLSLSSPAAATPPVKERLPLTLSGSDCGSKEAEMNNVLQAIPGVTGVYFNRVPDHVLVDITTGTVKAADVIDRVNNAASSWQCKVEIRKACINVDMPSASAAPHHNE